MAAEGNGEETEEAAAVLAPPVGTAPPGGRSCSSAPRHHTHLHRHGYRGEEDRWEEEAATSLRCASSPGLDSLPDSALRSCSPIPATPADGGRSPAPRRASRRSCSLVPAAPAAGSQSRCSPLEPRRIVAATASRASSPRGPSHGRGGEQQHCTGKGGKVKRLRGTGGEGRRVKGCEPASHGRCLAGEEDGQAQVNEAVPRAYAGHTNMIKFLQRERDKKFKVLH
jgi:hypothetical protein